MLTLLRIGWMNMKRDRVAQSLTFLLPIVFFSIFASVFGGRTGDSTPQVSVAVADEDRSEFSQRVIAALQKEKALRVTVAGANKDLGLLEQSGRVVVIRVTMRNEHRLNLLGVHALRIQLSENGGAARVGPSARIISFFDVEPSMMRPAIRTLWSVPTCPRVEILDKRLDTVSNSYTSTNPMPVELLKPRTTTV